MINREQVLSAYRRAWAHREEQAIRSELDRCWTTDSTYVSPLCDVVRGIDGMAGLILDFPVMFPEARVRPTSTADLHHDAAYFTWELTSTTRIRTMGRDYGLALHGMDFVEFDDDGKIRRITAFFGVDHHLPVAGGRGPGRNGSAPLDRPAYLDLDETARQPTGAHLA